MNPARELALSEALRLVSYSQQPYMSDQVVEVAEKFLAFLEG